MNKLGFSLMLLLCSGCASVYKAPTNGPTALLELDSNVLPVLVQHFADEQCTTSLNGTILAYLDQKFEESTGITKNIEANRRFIISLGVLSNYENLYETLRLASCNATGSFYPQTGVTYRTTFYMSPISSFYEEIKCHIGILRKEVRGEIVSYEPEESYRSSKKTCF